MMPGMFARIKALLAEIVEEERRTIIVLRHAVHLLEEIRDALKQPAGGAAAAQLEVTLPDGTVLKGAQLMATITDVQSITLKFVETDAKGNPTSTPPGPVTFTSSDPTIVAVLQATPGAPDAVASAVGPLGSASITASADGFTAAASITVVASAATGARLDEGTPTP